MDRHDDFNPILEELGEEGWELSAISGRDCVGNEIWYFKREIDKHGDRAKQTQ